MIGIEDCEIDTTLVDLNNCQYYLKCKHHKYFPLGHWVIMKCNDNQHYEYSINKCVSSNNSKCANFHKDIETPWKKSIQNKVVFDPHKTLIETTTINSPTNVTQITTTENTNSESTVVATDSMTTTNRNCTICNCTNRSLDLT